MNGFGPGTLQAVYDEIGDALQSIPGLRLGRWGDAPQPPGAYLSLPRTVQRLTQGSIELQDLELTVVVGRAVSRTALPDIMRWAGTVSEALEPRAWEAFDDLAVTRIEFDTVTIAGAPDVYLAAILHLDIAGA